MAVEARRVLLKLHRVLHHRRGTLSVFGIPSSFYGPEPGKLLTFTESLHSSKADCWAFIYRADSPRATNACTSFWEGFDCASLPLSVFLKQRRRIEAVTNVHQSNTRVIQGRQSLARVGFCGRTAETVRRGAQEVEWVPGSLTIPTQRVARSDDDTFSAECNECGAIFGHLAVERPDPRSLNLGCLLASSALNHFEVPNELSDLENSQNRTRRANCSARG